MEDRISILPDAVIHHIFSFMNVPDVIHTSILSNRWKHLWLSTPSLKFRYNSSDCEYIHEPLADCSDPLIRCRKCKESRIKHISFVDRVLITRRQSNIVEFEMCSFLDLDADHFLTWIIGVLRLHAQEIRVYFVIDDYLRLPDHLFNPYIRVLELKFSGMVIGLPNSFSRATRLKILDLSNVQFPNDNYDGEFILSCPVLETLKMYDCDLSDLAVFTVSAPLLKSLKLYSLYTVDLLFYSRYADAMEMVSCKVKTSAPNLRSLDVRISAPEECSSVVVSVEDLVSVVSASISIGARTGNEYIAQHCAQPLIDVLTGTSNVQVLKVSDHLVRVIEAIPESFERLPKLLHNLKSLMLMDEYAYDTRKKVLKVQEAVIFLERLPHTETLVWERNYMERSLYKDEDWVATMSFQGIFSCLKSFEYRNFVGYDAEQKFLEFLLERATVLKELIIKTPRLSSLSGNLRPCKEKLLSLSRYGDKLSSLPCASSMVRITYQLRS